MPGPPDDASAAASEDVLRRELRLSLDALEIAREEARAARRDLAAMQARLADVEHRARLGYVASRQVANVEFQERQRKEIARHQLLLRVARPLRRWRFFPALERTARRVRARLSP